MLGKLEGALADHKLTDNTYVVFSSDNGLHTGEYRLMPGKLTAFDTDIRVPLVIAGPRIPADATTNAMTENVDLAKTFSAFGATALPSDGHSLLDLLHGGQPADWRNAVLIEHHGSEPQIANPDAQSGVSGNPPSYGAIRTHRYLYVEYDNGEREFYDLQNDPYELHNLAAGLDAQRLAQLHQQLTDLRNCHSGPACWEAGHVGSGG
jgi:arylsulfatase A-like enzyme